MAYRNQNFMTNRLIKETVDKNQVGYVDPEAEENQQQETFVPKIYSFTSYDDDQGTNLWAEGTVETTNVESNGYTKVRVITNTVESFVNQEFYISSTATPDGTSLYPLYSDAGTTAVGIYVKIQQQETFVPKLYYFKSYDDNEGTNLWAEGTVETTEVESNGYTKVRVITNTVESFVNQEFYISSTATANGTSLYPLYSDAGTTAVGIYVKISETSF